MPLDFPTWQDTFDAQRDTRAQRAAFSRVRYAENQYSIQLRKIARHIRDLVKGFHAGNPNAVEEIASVLQRYSEMLKPWARSVAQKMLADVSRRDEKAWYEYAAHMGAALQRELQDAPTGQVLRKLMDEQVNLITSIPLDAAQRVQELAVGTLYTGARSDQIVAEIMKTGEVSLSRATLIARTEVGRVSSALTQVRAQHLGSEGYIWRTVGDIDVRPSKLLSAKEFARLNTRAKGSHRLLEGTYHKWSEPPISGPRGERSHPGAIYNCRCWAEPIIPEA